VRHSLGFTPAPATTEVVHPGRLEVAQVVPDVSGQALDERLVFAGLGHRVLLRVVTHGFGWWWLAV
jgi:hypothetical protein